MWNFKFAPFFILFGVAPWSFFNGATALKIGHWTFWDNEFHGRDARILGGLLVAIGVGALVWFGYLLVAATSGVWPFFR